MSRDASTTLEDLRDSVSDEESFIRFLNALAADRADEVAKEKLHLSHPGGPGANGWENGTIDALLESAAAWAQASGGDPAIWEISENPLR